MLFITIAVFRRTWTDAEELLKETSVFILFFVFLSEFVIRQVQTNIYWLLVVEILCNLLLLSEKVCLHFFPPLVGGVNKFSGQLVSS